jgi:hypothetical protein
MRVKSQEWTLRTKDSPEGVAHVEMQVGESDTPADQRRMVIDAPRAAWSARDAREFAALVSMVAEKLEAN